MQITTKTAAATQASATQTSSAQSASDAASATGDRFLALLVAQLKNQDPLNPLDNAQVTSQMAQINTVQGIGQLNTSMTQMLAEFQSLQAMTLANKDVLITGNTLNLAAAQGGGSAQARGGFDLASAATAVAVQIRDTQGNVVRTLPLGPQQAGTQVFNWDGLDDKGKAVMPGTYTFAVAASASGQAVQTASLTAAHVAGVANGAGGIRLNLGSLGTFGLADVRMVL